MPMGQPIFHDSIQHFESAATVHGSKVYYYDRWIAGGTKSGHKLPKVNVANHLSFKAKARITKYTELLFDVSKKKWLDWSDEYGFKCRAPYKIGFATLTLPSAQIHDDWEIHKKCFAPFLQFIKYHIPEFLFIWKAEVQDNGNLHYHLTTNAFIKHQWLCYWWNHYINKLGYVDRASTKAPHSTEIKAVVNHDGLAKYMSGYLTKKDMYTKKLKRFHKMHDSKLKTLSANEYKLPKNYLRNLKRKVTIKLWDCSMMLKTAKLSDFLDHHHLMELYKVPESKQKTVDQLVIVSIDAESKPMLKEVLKIRYAEIKRIREVTKTEMHNYTIDSELNVKKPQ
jgi:hypothetical protein